MRNNSVFLGYIFHVLAAVTLLATTVHAGLDKPHDISTGTGCLSCHQMTSTYPKLLPPLNHTPVAGDIDDTTSNGLCWSCHNDPTPSECVECHPDTPDPDHPFAPFVLTHSSLTTDNSHGNWTVECWVCHNQHLQEQKYNGSSYGKYIRRSINLANIKGATGSTFIDKEENPKSGIKSVVFKGQTGPNSFADGEGAIDGICEACHTTTTAWQNDGDYANDGAHKGLKGKNCMLCHPHTDGFKPDYQCLDCHADPANTEANLTRVNVKQQFSGNSHHVQRANGSIENTDCYQCHWEADNLGKITIHHGATPTSAVDLVIRDRDLDGNPGARPDTLTLGSTAIEYRAGSSTSLDLNPHCLGCHNDDFNNYIPTTGPEAGGIFGDGKGPNHYAWDGTCTTNPIYNGQKSECIANEGEDAWTPGTSVDERYSRTETTSWGKYDPVQYPNVENKYDQIKAYSAHGNAAANQHGWNPLAWESKTKVPASIYIGGDMVYPGTGDYIYATRGSSTNTFYRYSISSDSWATMQPAPGTISYGADLTSDGEYIYGLRGTNSKGFYRYSVSDGTWTILPEIPSPVSYGGAIVYPGSGDFIYAIVGNYSAKLYRYSITSNIWTEMRSADGTFSDGADLVYPGSGDYIYATRGYTTSTFYRYSISNNMWESRADAPFVFASGGSLAATGDPEYIYALPGDGQTGFLRYSISNNNWILLSALPQGVNNAGSLVNPGSGIYLYALPGGNSPSFFRYSIGELWPDTSGTAQVACFDCHNSHGSSAGDASKPATSYASATPSGGILKDTRMNKGGYAVDYTPAAGGSEGEKNEYNPGAGLCFDCHLSADGSTESVPWGYQTTFGASQAIMGYQDTAGFGNGTFGYQQKYQYKVGTNMGGHFGASSDLTAPGATHQINHLCTPCHDPHGISPSLATDDQPYAVPLLKGTFMTSPYKEDAAPASASEKMGGYTRYGGYQAASYPAYNIDQNTFASWDWSSTNTIGEDVNRFGGLCLRCHPQAVLNPDTGGDYSWRRMNRVHNTVRGWGGEGNNTNNSIHAFSCSKCHTVHNSKLPRLMITNCLDFNHRGRLASGGAPGENIGNTVYDSGCGGGSGSGRGKFPAGGQGNGAGGGSCDPSQSYTFNSRSGFGGILNGVSCHDNAPGNDPAGWPDNQRWNTVTPWLAPNLNNPTASSVTQDGAALGATLTNTGDKTLTARGTVWGSSPNPTGNVLAAAGTGTGVFSHSRSGLPNGAKIYYRGYVTDNTDTWYSPDGSFYTEPLTQASGVTFSSVSSWGMTVKWTRGDGDGVIVLMRTEIGLSNPADGNYDNYTANQVYPSGTLIGSSRVVYKGNGTSVAVSGLTSNTLYSVQVYEYKGSVDTVGVNLGTNYKYTPAIGTQATSAVAAPTLTTPTATNIGGTTATLGATITSNGGAAITERGTVWGEETNPAGNAIPEGDTATGLFTQNRTDLSPGTKIYYRGYATNSGGTSYSPDGSFYTEPVTPATDVSFSPVGTTGMTVNWTRGSGDGVIVLMKQGGSVDQPPDDGVYFSYVANPVFSLGSQIGTGNFVVYHGTGSSVMVTGLNGGTTYHVAVYEYTGEQDGSGADLGTNYSSSPATGFNPTITGTNHTVTYQFIPPGAKQTISIPPGATNIQLILKGAGGGGGRWDTNWGQEDGLAGHTVITQYPTADVILDIYVGGGGTPGSTTHMGASGGWGKPNGQSGKNGDFDDPDYCWAYGGAGGGGASAIFNGTTLLARAAGGDGGESGDNDGDDGYGDWCDNNGGRGGGGGGSDFPAAFSATGGGSGGASGAFGGIDPAAGGNGQIVISYDL